MLNDSGCALPYKNQEISISLMEHLAGALDTVECSLLYQMGVVLKFHSFPKCILLLYLRVLEFVPFKNIHPTIYSWRPKLACPRHISSCGSPDKILTSSLILGIDSIPLIKKTNAGLLCSFQFSFCFQLNAVETL